MFRLKVRDVMTERVITTRPDALLKEVARKLVDNAISGLPVVDDAGHVIGLISETDLLIKESGPGRTHHRPLWRLIGESEATNARLAKMDAITARDAMTAPGVVINPDRSVHEAAELMVERRINRLPVVDADGRLLGIVTRADIVRAFVRPDEELAQTIRDDVLRKTLWIDPSAIELSIADGVVHVGGTVDRRSTAEIIERIIGQVDGVVAVEAELTWQLDDRAIEAPEKDLVWPSDRT